MALILHVYYGFTAWYKSGNASISDSMWW